MLLKIHFVVFVRLDLRIKVQNPFKYPSCLVPYFFVTIPLKQYIEREVMSEKSLVCEQLEKQHPVHGALGRAYDLLGGDNLFYDWGLENPGGLLKMVMATTPSMQPVTSIAGDVILQVHPTLAPTALDGEREVNNNSMNVSSLNPNV